MKKRTRPPSNRRPRRAGPTGLHPFDLVRIHRGAAHLHDLGSRALAEALVELAEPDGAAAVLDLLDRYNRLTPAMIRAAEADRPRPRQLVVVP